MSAPHKHAFVGSDQEGTACIYVLHISEDGETEGYFEAELLQKIADKINDMQVLPKPAARGGRSSQQP